MPAIAVLDKVGVNRLSARLTKRCRAGAADRRGARPRDGARRRRRAAQRSGDALRRTGAARFRGAAHRARRRDGATGAAARSSRGLVCRQYPDRRAAAGQRAGRAHRLKTGTSYGYRDAWAVGFDGRMTIGIWVGRPDGAPVPGLIGRASAAPILFDAFARSGHGAAALPRAPKGAMVAPTDKLPPPLQRFRPGSLASDPTPPRILFPPDGARWNCLSATHPTRSRSKSRAVSGRFRSGERRADDGAARPPYAASHSGRAGICAVDRNGRPRRNRQRDRAAAIAFRRQ